MEERNVFGPLVFRKLFKSITTDNGCEFLDVARLRKSAFSKQKRTEIFYAHPYASWEKGYDIAKLTNKQLEEVTQWINNYPRKVIDFNTAQDLFDQTMKALAI